MSDGVPGDGADAPAAPMADAERRRRRFLAQSLRNTYDDRDSDALEWLLGHRVDDDRMAQSLRRACSIRDSGALEQLLEQIRDGRAL